MKHVELQDENTRAAGPLLLFFGGAVLSIAIGSLAGFPGYGLTASPIAGYGAIEFVLMFPGWIENRILPYLRTGGARRRENEKVADRYRKEEERAADPAEIHEKYWERREAEVFYYQSK